MAAKAFPDTIFRLLVNSLKKGFVTNPYVGGADFAMISATEWKSISITIKIYPYSPDRNSDGRLRGPTAQPGETQEIDRGALDDQPPPRFPAAGVRRECAHPAELRMSPAKRAWLRRAVVN